MIQPLPPLSWSHPTNLCMIARPCASKRSAAPLRFWRFWRIRITQLAVFWRPLDITTPFGVQIPFSSWSIAKKVRILLHWKWVISLCKMKLFVSRFYLRLDWSMASAWHQQPVSHWSHHAGSGLGCTTEVWRRLRRSRSRTARTMGRIHFHQGLLESFRNENRPQCTTCCIPR